VKVLKALDLGILKPPSIICVSYDMALKNNEKNCHLEYSNEDFGAERS
jgi:hypothetical protein